MSLPDRIARLNADGSQDTTFFSGGLNAPGYCITQVRDGKLIVGGSFTMIGSIVRNRLAVLNSNGTVHLKRLDANWDVFSLAEQTDGKVIVSGRFTQVDGVPRDCMARLTKALEVEPAFDPSANGTVRCVALSMAGTVYAGGAFTHVGDRDRYRLVRLFNDESDNLLTVETDSLVSWKLSGSLPETQRVQWQVDTGAGYGPLAGVTTRTTGGWKLVPTTALSGAGTVRVLSVPADSQSSGVQQALKTFDFSPEIVIKIGTNAILSSGTLAFGDVQTGVTSERKVTICNDGLATLTITSVLITGTAAAFYTKIDPLLSIAPLTEASCTVRFTPTSLGSQPAILTIVSNDADEASFVVNLLGEGTPGPGGVDLSWQPTVTALTASPIPIKTMAVRGTDLIIGGGVSAVNTTKRRRWAEINGFAAVLPQSGAVPTKDVWFIVPDLGGVVLFAQDYSNSGVAVGQTHRFVSGVLDATFKTTWPVGLFSDAVLMPDGAILVATIPTGLRRLQRDGKLDAAWPTHYDPVTYITCISPTTAGGYYLGSSRGAVTRHTSTGTVDTGFNYTLEAGSHVLQLSSTVDGGVMLMYQSGAGAPKLIKLTASGSVDAAFTAQVWLGLSDMLLQADGKVILWARNVAGYGILRLLTNGSNDPSWTGPSGQVSALSQDAVGRVFYATGGTSLKRLINGVGVQVLSAPSINRVTWERSGNMPEVCWVRLDLSEDGGSNYRDLGLCSRMTGGWERAGLSLPRNGRLRVQAYTGSGLITAEQNFSELLVPDIQVELGTSILEQGGTVRFAGRLPTQSSDVSLDIRNTGNANLTNLALAVTGPFKVVSLGVSSQANPTELMPGSASRCVLSFVPISGTLSGPISGTLVITSSVPGVKASLSFKLQANVVAAPSIISKSVPEKGAAFAVLRGIFKGNHDRAKVYFEYKEAISSIWIKTPEATIDNAFNATTIDITINGLTASTSYNYKASIYNELATLSDTSGSFSTIA